MAASHHACLLKRQNESKALFGKITLENLRTLFLISSTNPLNADYFRSKPSMEAEKKRQIETKCMTVIHPLSTFRIWYDIYVVILYLCNLVCKPLDAAFASKQRELYSGYRIVSITLDLLCWVDILVNFNTGFVVAKRKKIELRRRLIAKHYMSSPFFVCDVLSSLPRNLPYLFVDRPLKWILGIINIFGMLKFARIFTVITLINRTTRYFQFKNTTGRFLFNSFMVTSILIHWVSCMQFIVPRLVGRYFTDPDRPDERSWIYQDGLYRRNWKFKYAHCFFKGSAEMLGIRLDLYPISITSDYIVSTLTYWAGKIIIFSIWIVLVVAMLHARSMELKFYEVINQLDEYMKQKQLPLNLRDKITKYYDFRFQRLFFKEQMITNLLSTNLRREVNIHVCKSLIESVSFFADLPSDEISRLVARLISEIFLPNDTIIQSGTYSNSMYFISSGTVAVYSHSGKEICHLQDGAYFGVVTMVVKNQKSISTIVALETTKVYRLKRRDFERCLMKNKAVFNKLVSEAEVWLKTVLRIEDDYKKKLFQQNYATGANEKNEIGANEKNEIGANEKNEIDNSKFETIALMN
nr:potassium/sodium hyperpolarization-activated cyclic nucleotide-gated channel 1-like [Leptinotarsa decemlineata]